MKNRTFCGLRSTTGFRIAVWLIAGAWPAMAGPRLVIISVDGLRPDVINPLDTPRMAAMQASGAMAETALNDLPSATLPNHATMLSGVVSDLHGVILNVDTPGLIAVETLFDYAAAAGLRSHYFASKSKMDFLAPPGSVEWMEINGNTTVLVERFVAQLTSDGPDVLFLHLRDPDSIGHAAGWMTEPYLQAVRGMDELIGTVMDALALDTIRQTFVILTADHGGDGTNHFLNIAENRRIPWIVCGPGIPAGKRLTSEVTTADTTPTALWLLDLPVPAGLSGRVRTEVRDAGVSAGGGAPVVPVGLPCVLLAVPAGAALLLLGARGVRGARTG